MCRSLLLLAVVALLSAQAPITPPTPVKSTLIYNITATTILDCGVTCIDNRSAQNRQNNYHSYRASGTGTWSVDMQWADGTPTSWTSYGSTGQVSNVSPASAIGYGIDPISVAPSGKRYHDFVRFVITGSATVGNYTGIKDIWSLPSAGAISYPLSINQGGTGLSAPFVVFDILYPSLSGTGGACHAAALTGRPLLIIGSWTAQNTYTCDAPVVQSGGGTIQPASAQAITFSGSVNSPAVTIFDYSAGGAVLLTGVNPTVDPHWFNAGSSDMGAQVTFANAAALAGAILDGRGYSGSQAAAVSISIATNATLLLGGVTLTCASSPCINQTASFLRIEGTGASDGPLQTSIVMTPATGNAFQNSQSGSGGSYRVTQLSNFKISTTTSTTSVGANLAEVEDSFLDHMVISGFFGGVRVSGNGVDVRSVRVHLDHNLIEGTVDNAAAYSLHADHVADLYINNQDWYAGATTANYPKGLWLDKGVDGVYATSINMNSLPLYVNESSMSAYTGVYDGVPANFFGANILADSPTAGDAILFDGSLGANSIRFKCALCWADGSGNAGVDVSGGGDIQFVGGNARGNYGHGVFVDTAGENVSFIGFDSIANNTSASGANGYQLTSGGSVRVIGTRSESNATGIVCGAAMVDVEIADNILGGNTSAGLLDNCTNANFKHIWGNLPPGTDTSIATATNFTGALNGGTVQDGLTRAVISTLDRQNTAVPLTGTTNETDLKITSVAANLLGTSSCVRLTAGGTITGTAGTKEIRVYFGGSTVLYDTGAVAGTSPWNVMATLCNTTTGAQHGPFQGYGPDQTMRNYDSAGAVDTTSSQNLHLTGKLGNSGDTITADFWEVEMVR